MASITVGLGSVLTNGVGTLDNRQVKECETPDYLVVFAGTRLFREEVQTEFEVDPSLRHIDPEEPGWWILVNKHDYSVVVRNDLLGAFPLFWSTRDQQLFIFSSMTEAHAAFSFEPDEVGIVQFLRNGFCVGDRTLLKKLYRLRPGEQLRWAPGAGVTTEDRSCLWTSWDQRNSKQIVDEAVDRWIFACRSLDNAVIMFSAGWDSRTLLAGALHHKGQVALYTHGDLRSREVQIAARIATDCAIEHRLREIDGSMFEPNFIASSARKFENVIFPHWHAASGSVKGRGVSAGIYGAVFGGHNGPVMFAQGWRKPLALLKALYGKEKAGNEDGEGAESALALLMGPDSYELPWYAEGDRWVDNCQNVGKTSNQDVATEIERYKRRGVTSGIALIEAFTSEHRGTQYMLAQLHSAATEGEFVNPFANASVIKFACGVPYSLKVHNTLNKRVISSIAPRLLRYPLAATLCAASRPLLMQEGSRFLRKLIEDSQWWLSSKSNGAVRRPHFGWVDFRFMAHGNTLKDLVDSLEYDLFDKKRIWAFCSKLIQLNMSLHPLMDMIMKIKTVDGILSPKVRGLV